MVLVTLIGNMLAKEGTLFIYSGPVNDCRDCRLKTVCFNLDEGNHYKVTGLRDVQHDCKMHEGGVRVVEVEIVPIDASEESQRAIEGATISFEEPDCKHIGCAHYRLCHPLGISEEKKYRIMRVEDNLDCILGQQRKKIRMQ